MGLLNWQALIRIIKKAGYVDAVDASRSCDGVFGKALFAIAADAK